MHSPQLSNLEIADICRGLALLLHSGVSAADGLYLMAEEENDPRLHDVLTGMAATMDSGSYLYNAFEEAACFPAYITGLLQVGEEVGRTEETLQALAKHYESREQMRRQIVSSLTYPAILLMLMLGEALDRIMPLLCAALGVLMLFGGALCLHGGFRKALTSRWRRRWGDRGIARKINNARFAQALSMGFCSGMVLEDAVELASHLLKDTPDAVKRCKSCHEKLLQGAELADALGESQLLTRSDCRLLALGLRSGSVDSVMTQIAQRMEDDARQALEDAVAKVEPALVLVTSGLVGVILLSVMLPLMNIMTAIG